MAPFCCSGKCRPHCGTPPARRNKGSAWASFAFSSQGSPPSFLKNKKAGCPLEYERQGFPISWEQTLLFPIHAANRPNTFRVSLRYCGGQSLTPSLLRNRFPIRRMGAGGGVPSSAPESLSTSFHCAIILPHFRRESKANTKICSIAQSLSPESIPQGFSKKVHKCSSQWGMEAWVITPQIRFVS